MLVYPLPRLAANPGPHWLPLGLSFLASSLQKEGHEVKIFDPLVISKFDKPNRETINTVMIEAIKEFKPDLIGLNTVTPLIYDTVERISLIRKVNNGLIIAGGHHATAMPELTLKKIPGLDGLIQGEGELVLTALAGGKKPSSLPGVWWKDGNNITGSSPTQIKNLDSLPIPSLDLLDMDYYTTPGRLAIKSHHLSVASIITSRGCTQKCDFCTESLTYGKNVRTHSPEYIVEWINKLITDYNVEAIYFLDNDFLYNRERVQKICEKMIGGALKRKIKFSAQARVNRLDPDILKLLKRAGCIMLEMGFETINQAQLDSVQKMITVDMNNQAVEMCRKQGISIHAYLMHGFKGETIADLEAMARWLKKADKYFTITLSRLQVLPGTRLYKEYGKSFFENNPWTEKTVTEYFQTDYLSSITLQERNQWLRKNLIPEIRRRNSLSTLKRNSAPVLYQIALAKIKRIMSGREKRHYQLNIE